jgi:hypothetical protein
MRGPSDLAHEEYALTKVALAREDIPAEAFALLSAWIEGTPPTLSLPRCSLPETRW